MKKTKTPKAKPKYSLASDVGFLLDLGWQTMRPTYLLMGVRSAAEILLPVLAMLLPSRVIALLEAGAGFERLCGEILLFSLGMLLCGAGGPAIEEYTERHLIRPRQTLCSMADIKLVTTDYPHAERQEFQQLKEKRYRAICDNSSAGENGFRILRSLASSLIALGVYALVLGSLSPWLLLGVTALTGMSYLTRRAANNWVFRSRDQWTPLEHKMDYIHNEASNYRFAKDVRLFGLSGWLMELYEHYARLRDGWASRQGWVEFAADAADALVTFLREGAAYAWLLYGAVAGTMAPAAFVLYFTAVGNYSEQLMSFLREFSKLYRAHLDLAVVRELLDYPEEFRREGGRPLPQASAWELTLDHVSFRYPGAERDTIHDMCLTLRPGEKTALVGLNGAGKSTLVKLLCGLYDPTEGRVLLNGAPVTELNREEYYGLFSAVFQESAVRPYTLAKNVALTDKMDRDRVRRCLDLAGLAEKTGSLPKGMDTKLMKYIWHDGVDLSGGESQKLMLARALYKDGPIILLDEPTAALDPIAEAELYEKYGELTSGKTSLYISHRLASTRFCDRVLYLEDGRIREDGTHQELLDRQGKYYELYEIQSAYYRKNVHPQEGEQNDEAEMG